MVFQIKSRSLRRGALIVVAGFSSQNISARANPNMPLVPVLSKFRHWDNHWYLWLPQDKVYEAVEVISLDEGPSGRPLVWAFFTERGGNKRQVHFINDQGWAKEEGWHFREIQYQAAGSPGSPRGLAVRFNDDRNRSVAIELSVNGASPLSPAGLTNQSGHAAAKLLLMFFRSANTFATDWNVSVGGELVSRPGPTYVARFKPAYSNDISTALFPFDQGVARFSGEQLNDRREMVFQMSNETGRYVAKGRRGGTKQLHTDSEGRLTAYSDSDGRHAFHVDFASPLPSACAPVPEAKSAFAITIDGRANLLAGTVTYRAGNPGTLAWSFDSPIWAKGQPIQTSVIVDCVGLTQKIAVAAANSLSR